MGLGNLGDLSNLDLGQLQQLLPNLNFPASKDEVISEVQNNDAPQEVIDQIKNSSTDTFNNAEEVLQTLEAIRALPVYEGSQHEEPPADEELRLREGLAEALAQIGLDEAQIRQNQEALQEAIRVLQEEISTRLERNKEALQEAIRDQGEPRDYTVNLDKDAYLTAERLAQTRGISISRLLRTAITTQRWFDDVRAAEGRILVHAKGPLGVRTLREIVEIREGTKESESRATDK